jgi:CHAT domain-containing protein
MLATRQADGGKWAHPAFWAGFALIGAAKGL